MPFAIARRGNEHAHHFIDIVVIEAHVIRHCIGRTIDEFLEDPAVVHIYGFDIVELLGIFMNISPCRVAKAGNWHGQVSMSFAIIEIHVHAVDERPMGGGELHGFQDL